MDVNEAYERLINDEYFTEEELNLVCNINGYNIETLNDCVYARYGYRSVEQLYDEEYDDEEYDDEEYDDEDFDEFLEELEEVEYEEEE